MQPATSPPLRLVALALSSLLGATGCLGSTYRIPQEEALRLTQAPPGRRGEAVRVVQRWSTSRDPTGAARDVVVRPRVGYVVAVTSEGPPPRRSSSSSSGGSGSGSGGGSGNQGSASDAAAAALATLVLAAGAMAIVAGTEGARYDGFVRLPEDEPVYLMGPEDTNLRVPLAELRPEHVLWADEVVVSRPSGFDDRDELGRAPLERHGFTYALDVGMGSLLARDGQIPWGISGRLSFGGFPLEQLGILGTIGFGWAELDGQTVFHARYGLELDVYAIALDPLHIGLHAEAGDEHRLEDTSLGTTYGDHGLFWGAGPLVQLALTTRLALTLRGGLFGVEVEDDMTLLGEATIGLAVY